ncbi:MAG: PQQ-binding-like beta-propeller repeat protein [Chthoniobacteraceae bacterium]
MRLAPAAQIQARNLAMLGLGGLVLVLLMLWWLLASRAPWRLRLGVVLGVLALGVALRASLRFRGVTGDMLPIFEPRWTQRAATTLEKGAPHAALDDSGRPDFPQYLGPQRNAVIDAGPVLARDWKSEPPQILWRQPIGAAWSGCAIAGNRAVTFEQRGESEVVVCLDVLTGKLLWEHVYPARYASALGGEGPRSTPTIAGGRVFAFGATGTLTCLDLATGQRIWQRTQTPEGLPEWGYAGSPLIYEDNVIVSVGQPDGKSLFAYRLADGEVAWHGGSQPAAYASPAFLTLAGVPQIVSFNLVAITAHDPGTGAVLWEYPWGRRQPCVAQPVVVGADRVVFSSGYGIGCELLELQRDPAGKLGVQSLWKTISMKAKLTSFVHRDGYIYGLDDSILACVDLRDGSRKWKAGRYGHGQLLLVGDVLLITAESGEIVLVEPKPEAPMELARFRVFDSKTWNPPALSGDILLMRTDREIACVRLPVTKIP